MKRPPMLMHMRVEGHGRAFGLWLPLFLMLPLALVALILLCPLILVTTAILWPSGWGRRAWLTLRASVDMFCAMRGLSIDVHSGRQSMSVSVV
ncbi:MAG: hypothetical protein FJ020_05885 [Chloroflexi bacterium]|nr:hypothetical protein [Chloroflexota bacterium]